MTAEESQMTLEARWGLAVVILGVILTLVIIYGVIASSMYTAQPASSSKVSFHKDALSNDLTTLYNLGSWTQQFVGSDDQLTTVVSEGFAIIENNGDKTGACSHIGTDIATMSNVYNIAMSAHPNPGWSTQTLETIAMSTLEQLGTDVRAVC